MSISDDFKYNFVESGHGIKIFDGIMELVSFTIHNYNGTDWVSKPIDINNSLESKEMMDWCRPSILSV